MWLFGIFLDRRKSSYKQVSPGLLSEWKNRELVRGLSPVTVQGRLNGLSVFYRWLTQIGHLRKNPLDGFPRLKHSRKAIQVLDEQEMEELLKHARSPRDRAVLELLYATGCRRGEIVGLNLGDIALGPRKIRCTGKGRKKRIVLFSRPAGKALRDYLPWRSTLLKRRNHGSESALLINHLGTRLSGSGVQRLLARIAKRASLGKRVYSHLIRHSFTSHLSSRGADLSVVQALLGHKYPVTTARYTHLSRKRIHHVYRRSHPWA
jgi:site-specific recombinase XerD